MSLSDVTVYVRNADLGREVEVEDFEKLDLVLRYQDLSSWVLTVPADGPAAAAFTWDAGIVVRRGDEVLLSGPMTMYHRSSKSGSESLEVGGLDDTVWLARRVAWPEAPALTTATDEHDVRTGPASDVIASYVNANAGPGAHATMQVPHLAAPPSPGLGTTVTGRARFDKLLDLVRSLAIAGGDLGFRIVQAENVGMQELQLDIYEPADKTADVRFTRELETLGDFDYTLRAPEANYVVAGGGGEGTARTFRTGSDAASITDHGLIAAFRDQRQTTDTGELDQAIDEELAARASTVALQLEPIETEAIRFGHDYGLGDLVAATVDGAALTGVVREVAVIFDANSGETVKPLIGSPSAGALIRQRRNDRRLSNLERR